MKGRRHPQNHKYLHSITNLKFWGKDEKILSSTLSLLNDLTVGYATVRRLLKTEEIQLLLRNHSVSLW
jgi:exportin-7